MYAYSLTKHGRNMQSIEELGSSFLAILYRTPIAGALGSPQMQPQINTFNDFMDAAKSVVCSGNSPNANVQTTLVNQMNSLLPGGSVDLSSLGVSGVAPITVP